MWRLFVFSLVLAGCAAPHTDVMPAEGIELTHVPFHPQKAYQCGPAALATVLNAADVVVSPDELTSAVYLPGREGSLQYELLAATRARGHLAYVVDPALPAIVDELRAGRPVLVLQNLGVRAIPVWHYAVVVGVDPARGEFVLRSGTDRRRLMSAEKFDRTWARSDRWGFVVLDPGELPANPVPERYFEATAALEASGQLDAAARGYRAMARRWPENADAAMGLGNVFLAEDRPEAAERQYRRAIALSDGTLTIARNNLAVALLARGCAALALSEAEAALASLASDDPHAEAVRDTVREARQAVASGRVCAATSDALEDVGDAEQVQNDDDDKHDADDGEQ